MCILYLGYVHSISWIFQVTEPDAHFPLFLSRYFLLARILFWFFRSPFPIFLSSCIFFLSLSLSLSLSLALFSLSLFTFLSLSLSLSLSLLLVAAPRGFPSPCEIRPPFLPRIFWLPLERSGEGILSLRPLTRSIPRCATTTTTTRMWPCRKQTPIMMNNTLSTSLLAYGIKCPLFLPRIEEPNTPRVIWRSSFRSWRAWKVATRRL